MKETHKIEKGKRLKQQLDLLGVNQKDVAKLFSGGESFISRMINGGINITTKTLYKIKKEFSDFDIDFVEGKSNENKIINFDTEKDILIKDLKEENAALKKVIGIYLKKDNEGESFNSDDVICDNNNNIKKERNKNS